MKRIFEIEFPDDCEPLWMNKDNLALVMNTKEHCGKGLIQNIIDRIDDEYGNPIQLTSKICN